MTLNCYSTSFICCLNYVKLSECCFALSNWRSR